MDTNGSDKVTQLVPGAGEKRKAVGDEAQEKRQKRSQQQPLQPEQPWWDKDFVLNQVRKDGLLLEHVSSSLRDDEEVVTAAVQQNPHALMWASERLQGDKDIVRVAVQKDAKALAWAIEKVRDDKDTVMMAVQQKKLIALKFASKRLKEEDVDVRNAIIAGVDELNLKDDAMMLRELIMRG